MMNKTKEMNKLNLGSGVDYKDGWVNIDIGNKNNRGEDIKVDVIHDLDKFPYPFKNNAFDYILLNQVLEHLDRPEKVLQELIRISKNNAIIKIRVPHFSDVGAYEEPTHRHYFAINSIEKMKYNSEIIEKKFEYSNNLILKMVGRLLTISPFLYERFLHNLLPIQGIKWVLKVRK